MPVSISVDLCIGLPVSLNNRWPVHYQKIKESMYDHSG